MATPSLNAFGDDGSFSAEGTMPASPAPPSVGAVMKAVETMAEAEAAQRGAVFTRREVAEFVLDLAGYTPDQPLARWRLLEPSFGCGDFLLPALDRLLAAWAG